MCLAIIFLTRNNKLVNLWRTKSFDRLGNILYGARHTIREANSEETIVTLLLKLLLNIKKRFLIVSDTLTSDDNTNM